ncbi:hypothetical protein SISSUDRAFT_1067832 [Sistotremastrum suecicum HHB10207 ss-3]|uniref:Ubiquitin-like protease family profile domain-containing protein n=1 Tax=Sistotremastrum suecicum HHB10207 ss-3 TaxID=1314776 RepID=A0A165WMV8_9AGAM|nr:hypothetical protein SISSUDRAFT_1067832 [Sistotremastrum suecicum HHB10207 ss-3]
MDVDPPPKAKLAIPDYIPDSVLPPLNASVASIMLFDQIPNPSPDLRSPTVPQQWLSPETPSEKFEVKLLQNIPIPSAQQIGDLLDYLDVNKAALRDSNSVTPIHLSNKKLHLQLPLWVVTYWDRMSFLRVQRDDWRASLAWARQKVLLAMKDKLRKPPLRALQAALESMAAASYLQGPNGSLGCVYDKASNEYILALPGYLHAGTCLFFSAKLPYLYLASTVGRYLPKCPAANLIPAYGVLGRYPWQVYLRISLNGLYSLEALVYELTSYLGDQRLSGQHIRQLTELASSHIRKTSQSLSIPIHIADLEFLDSLMAAFKRPEQYSSERKFASLRAVGEDVQLEDITKIGGIMHVNGNHYTAYVLDTKHHTLMYGDSGGDSIPEAEKNALKWWFELHTGASERLKLVPLEIGSQDDATSCGIVALNALLHYFLPSQFPLFESSSKTYLACKRIETCFEIADMSLKWTSTPAVQLELGTDSPVDAADAGAGPVQNQPSDVKQAEPKESNNDAPAPSGVANLSPSNPFAPFVTSKALSFGAKSTKSSSGSSKKKLDDLPQSTLPFRKISDDAYALQVSKGLESVSEDRTTWEEHAEGVRRAKRESLRDYDRERKQKQRHEQKEKDRVAGIRDDDLRLIKKLPTKIVTLKDHDDSGEKVRSTEDSSPRPEDSSRWQSSAASLR